MKGVDMCDALFHRLTVQVTNFSVEDSSGGVSESKEVRKLIAKKDGDPTRIKKLFEATSIFDLKQLNSPNDPSKAGQSLESYSTNWKAFLGNI